MSTPAPLPCRECGADVSAETLECPECGVARPGIERRSLREGTAHGAKVLGGTFLGGFGCTLIPFAFLAALILAALLVVALISLV